VPGLLTGPGTHYYPPDARVVALDMSWDILIRARQRIRWPLRGVLIGDLAHLPLRHASVDAATATFVCCVQTDPAWAAREIKGVLTSEGQAVLM
jgi:ubiquinone/menaquinone biosynthesis C-methylase UbiE